MIFATLSLIVSLVNPEPFVVQSAIDSARIIGLPRIYTLDHFFAKRSVDMGEFEPLVLLSYRGIRKEFFKNYFKINFINVNRD